MAAPQITPLPTAPSRNQAPDDFIADADTWVGAQTPMTEEINTISTFMEVQANAAEASEVAAAASAVAADASAGIALAAANFAGTWSSLTGALNVPSSVLHDDKFWMLLNNLADVTASEPGVTADWQEITFQFDWGDIETTSQTAVMNRGYIFDVAAGSDTLTLPTPFDAVGEELKVTVIDTTDPKSGNILTIAKSSNVIYRADGFTVVAASPDDGNLALRIGDTVQLITTGTTKIKVA